ncbi:MAG: toprim domain-containing protein [Rhodocyclaceae bacterium]|nr:toprim domain-containing protein [Rhodocyclaceae bacterium]
MAEGYATGASLHEATGHAVAVAFDCGNLKPVAEALRAKYPEARLIVCADNDQFTEGNPGVTKGREAVEAAGAGLAVPEFADLAGEPTDFNDLAQREGGAKVREAIHAALEALGMPRYHPPPESRAAARIPRRLPVNRRPRPRKSTEASS